MRYLESTQLFSIVLILFLSASASGTRAEGSTTSPSTERNTRRPNIIFILADDLGWGELGYEGNRFHHTPNVDKLAQQGMRFTQAYTAAPVCSPTRASFLSGQFPARVGITDYLRPADPKHLRTSHFTLAEALKSAGYVTGIIGKWHLTGYRNHGAKEVPPTKHGFDEVIVSENRGIGGGSYYFPYHFNREIKQRIEGKEYLVDRCNLEAVEFIERNKARPFFLFLSHYAVHTRLVGKPKLVAKYEQKKDGRDTPGAKNNPHLAAQLETIDDGVGLILTKLQALGLAENTIVIFTSDNGGEGRVTHNGGLRGAKSTLYEGGVRVPFVVRWPGTISGGTICNVPIITMDYYLTFLEAANIEPNPKQHLDGRSILSLWKDPKTKWKPRPLYWHYPLKKPHFLGGRSGGAIRVNDFKLKEDFTTGALVLFDLKTDPFEKKNLAATMSTKVRELHDQLKAWRKEVGAKIVRHAKTKASPKRRPTGTPISLVVNAKTLKFQNFGVRGKKTMRFDGNASYLNLARQDAPEVAKQPIRISAIVKSTKPNGVILAHGGDKSGYSLYLKDGKPTFSVCVKWKRTTIQSRNKLGEANATLEVIWDAKGEMRLLVDGKIAAKGISKGLLRANPGDTLHVGADLIKPVGEYRVPNHYRGAISNLRLEIGTKGRRSR
ncbi:MAG: sulfatase-like hydrolase/transferase [Gemmataceae bacterium]